MRPMPRTLPSLPPKNPMYTVSSTSRAKDKLGNIGGLTFSEESGDNETSAAEYEVLKAIIVREDYLTRLLLVARTVAKKFKPEVADLLDLVRISSLDVIDAIENWRNIKKDSDASFIWNGINYLLKMPSDLDFLADYPAIVKWMGFALERNPFCVPFAMSQQVVEEALIDPQHIQTGLSRTDGFTVGGRLLSSSSQRTRRSSSNNESRPSPYGKLRSKSRGSENIDRKSAQDSQSFIFNEDMRKIRRAEAIILKAEAKFGAYCKDPSGRLIPLVQALTKHAENQLKKDDKRPMTEPAHANITYAPHAAQSDVGVAQEAWTPAESDRRKDGGKNPQPPPLTASRAFLPDKNASFTRR